MGFLASSASICYFQVSGTIDLTTKKTSLTEKLESDAFQSIENSGEELSIGWVRMDDYDSTDFTSGEYCWRDDNLCFYPAPGPAPHSGSTLETRNRTAV